MKFIADSMLGRLAKLLRLLGHDTSYYPHIEDSLLLRIAREEDRVLLTRDTRLVKVRGLNKYLLLAENGPFEQLKKVVTTFDLMPFDLGKGGDRFQTCLYGRCSLCNSILEDIPKEQARGRVPEYVYITTESFRKCPKCDKFYWEGTHRERLIKKLKDVLCS